MNGLLLSLALSFLMVSSAHAGKISDRASATTLDGTETLGVIKSGVGKKTTLSQMGVMSNSGIPAGGHVPVDMDGSNSSRGCSIKLNGGNLGNTAYTGSNFLMACDTQDQTGRFFTIWNNDSASLPKTLFEVRRNGFTFANGFSVQQTQTYNTPTYYTAQGFDYGDAAGVWAAMNVTTDVSSTKVPVLGVWGLVSQYGGSLPPLLRMYGSTTHNVGLGYTTGTLRAQITDAGIFTLGPMTTLTNLSGGEFALANAKRLTWAHFDGTFDAASGIQFDANNNLKYTQAFDSQIHSFSWPTGADRLWFQLANSGAGITFFGESSADHAAPAANSAVLYTKDNGSGKTTLCARFNTGAVQCFATEP